MRVREESMFRRVLVPLDGSRFAESALPIALSLVESGGAQLHLVQVHQPATALVGMGDAAFPSLALEAQSRSRERSYVAAVAATLSTSCGQAVEFRQIDGIGGPGLCEAASRIGIDLVVMAAHGYSPFRRFWFGSVADYVVRHVTVPVLLVPPGGASASRIAPPLCDILVALDFSTASEAILAPVTALARVTGAALTLVHVCHVAPEIGFAGTPSSGGSSAEALDACRRAARARLDRTAALLRERGIRVFTRLVLDAGASSGLLDLLEEDEFDFIAMTTHGRGGMRRLLLGSVADRDSGNQEAGAGAASAGGGEIEGAVRYRSFAGVAVIFMVGYSGGARPFAARPLRPVNSSRRTRGPAVVRGIGECRLPPVAAVNCGPGV
jgi:nucleotide-binding universal stress UspA family protein